MHMNNTQLYGYIWRRFIYSYTWTIIVAINYVCFVITYPFRNERCKNTDAIYVSIASTITKT